MSKLDNYKPWLGVVVLKEKDDKDETIGIDVIYYTGKPIMGSNVEQVKKRLFADAIKENEDADPANMEIYVVPFGLQAR